MQTFLPYPIFIHSLQCLDNKRLGKQRVEAMQILNALEPESTSRWRNHPAVRMWKGYEDSLAIYHDIAIILWIEKGFNNSMKFRSGYAFSCTRYTFKIDKINPPWLTEEFCAAHRSNLLRKDPVHYGKFGWAEPHDLPYIWPV